MMLEKNKMAETEGVKENKRISGKVFVFTAPRFDPNINAIQKQVEPKRKHFNWEVTQFDMDLNSSNAPLKKIKPLGTIMNEESSNDSMEAFSGLKLHHGYEDIDVRNSLITYLEDTFSENSTQLSQGFIIESKEDVEKPSDTTLTKPSVQEEYAFSLEQSQKLFNNMQGFVEMSMVDELSKSESQFSAERSDETEDMQSLSSSLASNENVVTHSCPFTKLSDCTQHHSTVSVFVVVLQVNPIKEIKIKSGINCGQFIKVSSILVGDSSKEYFKLTFWRKAAEWVNSLKDGDILAVKKIKIEIWNQEFYGQSSYGTTIVNLQRDGTYKVPAQWLTTVSHTEAKSLLKWLKRKHPYLKTNKAPLCEDVQWKALKQFVPNTLVHYNAKIVKVLTYSGAPKGKYEFEKRQMNKIVAVAVDEETSEEVPIYLWGRQADWQYELKLRIGHTWNFTFLRVECNSIFGQLHLHTTPQSSKKLQNKETTVFGHSELLRPLENGSSTFSSISELLKANFNGKAIISAGVTKITYTGTTQSLRSERSIDKTSDMMKVHEFFNELVYLGCKLCFRALPQDHNGIYTHCSFCMQHDSSYMYGVMYCFKHCFVYLADKSASIIAKSSRESTSKFLKELRPQDVLEDANSNMLFERTKDVFGTVNKNAKAVLTCETILDENDFVKSKNFELTAFQM